MDSFSEEVLEVFNNATIKVNEQLITLDSIPRCTKIQNGVLVRQDTGKIVDVALGSLVGISTAVGAGGAIGTAVTSTSSGWFSHVFLSATGVTTGSQVSTSLAIGGFMSGILFGAAIGTKHLIEYLVSDASAVNDDLLNDLLTLRDELPDLLEIFEKNRCLNSKIRHEILENVETVSGQLSMLNCHIKNHKSHMIASMNIANIICKLSQKVEKLTARNSKHKLVREKLMINLQQLEKRLLFLKQNNLGLLSKLYQLELFKKQQTVKIKYLQESLSALAQDLERNKVRDQQLVKLRETLTAQMQAIHEKVAVADPVACKSSCGMKACSDEMYSLNEMIKRQQLDISKMIKIMHKQKQQSKFLMQYIQVKQKSGHGFFDGIPKYDEQAGATQLSSKDLPVFSTLGELDAEQTVFRFQ